MNEYLDAKFLVLSVMNFLKGSVDVSCFNTSFSCARKRTLSTHGLVPVNTHFYLCWQ